MKEEEGDWRENHGEWGVGGAVEEGCRCRDGGGDAGKQRRWLKGGGASLAAPTGTTTTE